MSLKLRGQQSTDAIGVAPVDIASIGTLPIGGDSVSTARVNASIRHLLGRSRQETQHRWLRAVARLVVDLRPDIGDQLRAHLRVDPLADGSPLGRLSIGEIGVVYEALTALTDRQRRKGRGQYFTPDDVAAFMAGRAGQFPAGRWLDPCCGVGNLSWHLANGMDDPDEFVTRRLSLADLDPVALVTATVLLVASFARPGSLEALPRLVERAHRHNFLTSASSPRHDFVIVNPPYGPTSRVEGLRTANTREHYAYFLERITTESRGFIAITPAAFLAAPKYAVLRRVLEERRGGDVLVFDNVPDTCFRGYKFGSTNTSRTNFVRAAITVCSPDDTRWRVTPILRWMARSRSRLWERAEEFLVPLRTGPAGEWAKVMPGTEAVWDALRAAPGRLRDLVAPGPTAYALDVASTPRYYVSAAKRTLDRSSKHTLYFDGDADRDAAYLLLNSSVSYWWWRCLDGGITLSRRTLLSLPVPTGLRINADLVGRLERSEREHVVTKLNAGRQNENIRHPRGLVEEIDAHVLAGLDYDFELVYAADMFHDRPAQTTKTAVARNDRKVGTERGDEGT